MLGLTLGLGLTTFGCTGDEDPGDTDAATANDSIDPTNEADAVTYAGPDTFNSSSGGGADTVDVTTDYTTSGASSDTTTGQGTTSDTGTTSEGCVVITDDASAIGNACQVDGDCPDGYTCQPFLGIALDLQCQVLCEQTCECPAGLTCNEMVDKGGVPWFQCG